jgi:hypothetical protein
MATQEVVHLWCLLGVKAARVGRGFESAKSCLSLLSRHHIIYKTTRRVLQNAQVDSINLAGMLKSAGFSETAMGHHESVDVH